MSTFDNVVYCAVSGYSVCVCDVGSVAFEVVDEGVTFHYLYVAFEAHHKAPYSVEATDGTVVNPVLLVLILHIVRREFFGFAQDHHLLAENAVLLVNVLLRERVFLHHQVLGQIVHP